MAKSPDAFRTIREVSEWLDTPAHVLRFWESKFRQVAPVKRAGGRRYYRGSDMLLLGGIKKLLHEDGMTIKGVIRLLRSDGIKSVQALSQPLDSDLPAPPAPDNQDHNMPPAEIPNVVQDTSPEHPVDEAVIDSKVEAEKAPLDDASLPEELNMNTPEAPTSDAPDLFSMTPADNVPSPTQDLSTADEDTAPNVELAPIATPVEPQSVDIDGAANISLETQPAPDATEIDIPDQMQSALGDETASIATPDADSPLPPMEELAGADDETTQAPALDTPKITPLDLTPPGDPQPDVLQDSSPIETHTIDVVETPPLEGDTHTVETDAPSDISAPVAPEITTAVETPAAVQGAPHAEIPVDTPLPVADLEEITLPEMPPVDAQPPMVTTDTQIEPIEQPTPVQMVKVAPDPKEGDILLDSTPLLSTILETPTSDLIAARPALEVAVGRLEALRSRMINR
ncbi:MerR family transcriptional regulator [Halocynthiibacter namhaensis]|uniref:MerR family transcriptional regulator n=1 Tax=Halocynthiibacter namhaensis TaxID=1290553 RepID=UPI0009DE537C|nr:MerR family transcriptional regulator [Halocynthiibacter namhaensis]